ncbi:MAG: protoporphyrinogen oxidase [Dermatophilaceae bacterium]
MVGFVAGAAVGYVFGTRAGRARYEQIRRGAHRAWTSDPVQQRLDQAGQAVRTQALPYVADKVGDAIKAAGRSVKDRATRTLPATVETRGNGALYADATPPPR